MGVTEGYNRSNRGLQKGLPRVTIGVTDGYNRGNGGLQKGLPRVTKGVTELVKHITSFYYKRAISPGGLRGWSFSS